MPEVRPYRRFGWSYMLVNVASMSPFGAVFAFIWYRASTDRVDAWFWFAVGLFVLGAVFGLWWQAFRSRRMRCPQCGTTIVRMNHPGPNQPINFTCRRCDVEWATGLRVSED